MKTKKLTICALCLALITIGAFIKIPLPYFDYVTLQYFFVMMSGMLLGSTLGATVVGIYLFAGLLGLPIFAAGGGISYLLRPTFGFLLGFLPAVWVSGKIVEHGKRQDIKTGLLSASSALIITYTIGLVYKYLILRFYTKTGINWEIILLSVFPLQLPKDIAFTILAGLAYPTLPNMLRMYAPSRKQHLSKVSEI